MKRSDAPLERLESSGLDVMDCDERWGSHRMKIASGEIAKHEVRLFELLNEANQAANL